MPQGEVGRIFVGNTFPFEGYTGGGHKAIIDGLMSSGDVGYFDEHGLLYVSGRDDEMIVCGGENVFPAEVEDLISGHPDVVEATAIGVEDKEWGHRLRAFVVKDGASVDEDTIKHYVQGQPGPLQGAARSDLPRRAAAQPDGQDPQARAARDGDRLAPRLDGPNDLCREVRVDQQLIDEGGEHFLPGHPGDAQAVGGFALPDVERPVRARREVNGPPGPLAAPGLIACPPVGGGLGLAGLPEPAV